MSRSRSADVDAVVVTGVGLVTCLGLDLSTTWRGVCESRPGIGPLTELEQSPKPDKGGGQALPLPDGFAPGLPREARYLRHAITAALREAQLDQPPEHSARPPHRRGLMMGTTLHGIRAAGRYFRTLDLAEFREFSAPAILDLAAGDLGLSGFAATTCSACSSGLGSIAAAVTLLQSGELDLVVSGGYDPISEYTYAGFNSLRLIADGPARPFCRDRQGLKLGEGYGVLVLERAADARRRGARPLAVIRGFGESADAHHLTQPQPDGLGAARAIQAALDDAGIRAQDIDLICPHATGTPDNDGAEHQALRHVFGDRLARTPCTAFKSHLGHTLGGAGAVELVLTIAAMEQGLVPPTRNAAADELACEGISLSSVPRPADIRTTINLSLGFGGANTCLVVGKPDVQAPTVLTTAATPREVFVTGVGVVMPGGAGNAAFVERIHGDGQRPVTTDTGEIGDDVLLPLIQSRRVRRMSQYVKLTLAAASLACRDAAIDDPTRFAETCSAVLGSGHGSANYSSDFYRQVIEQGIEAANPMLFAEGVPNAGAAHLSLMLGIHGGCQTILGSRTAGLDALRLAWLRVRDGRWDRAIVVAADEYTPLVNAAYGGCGHYGGGRDGGTPFGTDRGFVSGAGAAALILEAHPSLRDRSVEPRGRIDACASGVFPSSDSRAAIVAAGRALDGIGRPDHVISSANGTWLDRIESAAIKRGPNAGAGPIVSSLYGHLPETFSAAPIAAVALMLLSGRMPRLCGDGSSSIEAFSSADGGERPGVVGILSSDYGGLIAAARVTIRPERIGMC